MRDKSIPEMLRHIGKASDSEAARRLSFEAQRPIAATPSSRRNFSQEEKKRGQRLFGGLLSTLQVRPHQTPSRRNGSRPRNDSRNERSTSEPKMRSAGSRPKLAKPGPYYAEDRTGCVRLRKWWSYSAILSRRYTVC